MQLNCSHLKILKSKIYSSSLSLSLSLLSRSLCSCYLMTRFSCLNHSCFFSLFLSQCKIPNFYCWFLWEKPWLDQKSEMASFRRIKKIVKRRNFITGIKIFTGNNSIVPIAFIWYLPIVNFCHSFPFWRIQDIFFANDASSVTLFYMALMLRIWHTNLLEALRF